MASSPQASTLWQGSPSRWLLINTATVTLLAVLVGIIATFSYFGILVSEEIRWLRSAQVFFAKFTPVIYVAWGLAVLLSLNLLVKYLKIRFENYVLTNDRLKFSVGILTRSFDETMLFRVVDSTVELPILLRIIGRGHVIVYSNDPSEESSGINTSFNTADGRKGVYLSAVKDPQRVKEMLDEHVEKARQQRGVRSTELM